MSEQTRIYEATVRNFITENLLLDRILNAFTYEEILNYLKDYEVNIYTQKITNGVKKRFFDNVNSFFGGSFTVEKINKDLNKTGENFNIEKYDEELKTAIENYLKK